LQVVGVVDNRLVHICAGGQFCSGYLIAPSLVLTARRGVCDGAAPLPDIAIRRPSDQESYQCVVTRQVTDSGLALLRVIDPTWPAPHLESAVRLGHLADADSLTSNQDIYECVARGFPVAQRQNDARIIEEVEGRIRPPTHSTPPQAFQIQIVSSEPDTLEPHSRWRGMSGAAVFCDGLLIGVIDDTPNIPARLTAAPLTMLLADEAAVLLLAQAGIATTAVAARPSVLPPRKRRSVADPASSDADRKLMPDYPPLGPDARGEPARQAGRYEYSGPRSPVVWPHRVGRIPDLADAYQHRKVADEVASALSTANTVVTTQVLTGLGGVGKTQIASYVAREALQGHTVDLLVWVPASSRNAIVDRYAEAANDVTSAEMGNAEQAAQRFLAWLDGVDLRWLVVLDDITEPADLRGLWPPSTRTGRTIVTTRRKDAVLLESGRRLVEVNVFSENEADRYLSEKLRRRPGALTQSDLLPEDLGWLPLALSQAAAYIVDRDIDCATYRTRFADRSRTLGQLEPETSVIPDGYHATIAVTWSLSIEAADRLTPTHLAKPVLSLLSVLDAAGAPMSVLSSTAVLDFVSRARAERTGNSGPVTADDARDAVHCLRRFNLTSAPTSGDNSVVRVHALVQRATREQLSAVRLGAVARCLADGLVEVWPEVERDRATGQTLRANAAAVRDALEDHLWSPIPHKLLFRIGESLGEAGLHPAAVSHFRQLVDSCVRRLGPDHRDTLTARHQLADRQGEAGDPAGAVSALEQLLSDRDRVLGAADPHTLTTRHTLADWRGENEDAKTAVAELARLLPDRVRLLGADHRDTLTTRRSLARWRGESGDPEGAVAELVRLVADRERILGPHHRDTLDGRHGLAYWRAMAGDLPGAIAAFEQLCADAGRVLGADHMDTLNARHALAAWRGEAGDLEGAVCDFDRLAADRERVLGADHRDTLSTRVSLQHWRRQAGDLSGAIAGLAALLPTMQRVLGADHRDVLTARHNLGAWRGRTGDLARAIADLDTLLPDLDRVLGPDNTYTLTTRYTLADLRGEDADYTEAVRDLEQLLDTETRVQGHDHPSTLITRSALARWRAEAGDLPGAIADLQALLPDVERVLGPDHTDTLSLRYTLAGRRGENGEPGGAVRDLENLLDIESRVQGRDHPSTLITRSTLARWRAEAGDLSGAIADLQALVPDLERVLGADHADALSARASLARWWSESGDITRAISGLEQLVVDQQRILGLEHVDTLRTRHNLATRRAEAGDLPRAIADLETLRPDLERVLGADHIHSLTIRYTLATWRARVGELSSAIDELQQLVADRQRVLGADHIDTLATRYTLATVHRSADDLPGAIADLQTLRPDLERVLGADHIETLTIRYTLATWRAEADDLAGAVRDLEQLAVDRRRILDADREDTAVAHTLSRTLHTLARLLERTGDLPRALTYHQARLTRLMAQQDQDPVAIAVTWYDIADVHRASNRPEDAVVAYGSAMDYRAEFDEEQEAEFGSATALDLVLPFGGEEVADASYRLRDDKLDLIIQPGPCGLVIPDTALFTKGRDYLLLPAISDHPTNGDTSDVIISVPYVDGTINKASYLLDRGYLVVLYHPGEPALPFSRVDVEISRRSGGDRAGDLPAD
jgi:tetratricopeptide (TPR) repeat protein